jgi:hypothetical protein
LIPAPAGIVARYRHEDDGRVHFTEKAVIAFDDDGYALVISDKTGQSAGRLVRADTYRNFSSLSDNPEYADYMTLIPAGGWRVELTGKDGSRWSEPLVGWALNTDGTVVSLSTDSTGSVDDFDLYVKDGYRIYHPDQWDTPAPGEDAGTGAGGSDRGGPE